MKHSSLVLLFGVGFVLLSFSSAQTERYQSRSRVRSRARPTSLEDDLPADEDTQRSPVVALRRVRPLLPSLEDQREHASPRIHLYAAEPQYTEDDGDSGSARRVVIIPQARSDAQYRAVTNDASYQGLYGRQVVSRQDEDGSRYRHRSGLDVQSLGPKSARTKESASRAPPVQTIRNYSKINDDGSFTFGYEAADGSFKEETRGTDCVVRGKYGYVDPDGNKREFTYVSGNPCDPNAVEEDEEEDERKENDQEENIPQLPIRPLQRPALRTQQNVPTTVFQQAYQQPESAYDSAIHRQPTRLTSQPVRNQVLRERPVIGPSYTTTTPEPTQPPATTYRPDHSRRPNLVLTRPATPYSGRTGYGTPAPPPISSAIVTHIRPIQSQTGSSGFDFDAELRKFQLDNNVVAKAPRVQGAITDGQHQTYRPQSFLRQQYQQPQQILRTVQEPRPVQPNRQKQVQLDVTRSQTQPQKTGNPIYTSQLIFDPASGQYNTVLYQPLPKLHGGAEINLNHQLQPYVHQQQQQYNPQQIFRPVNPSLYQQQQNPQQYYYVSPHQRSSFSSGQIDDFLRGQNVQF